MISTATRTFTAVPEYDWNWRVQRDDENNIFDGTSANNIVGSGGRRPQFNGTAMQADHLPPQAAMRSDQLLTREYYVYDDAWSILMPSANHRRSTEFFQSWRNDNRIVGDDYSNVTWDQVRELTDAMMDASGVPVACREQLWRRFAEYARERVCALLSNVTVTIVEKTAQLQNMFAYAVSLLDPALITIDDAIAADVCSRYRR